MICFLNNDKRIEKCKVEFDEEALNRIKLEAIHFCSEIDHCEYEGTEEPNYFDYLKIRNYRRVKIGRTDPNDFYSQPENIYRMSYDKYTYPYLVKLIDELLKGNSAAVYEILKPDYTKEAVSFEERISKLKSEISQIDDLNTNEKISKLASLQNLIEQAKSNNNQKPIAEYYEQAKNAITLTLLDSVNVSDIAKVSAFFELSSDKIYTKDSSSSEALKYLLGVVNDE